VIAAAMKVLGMSKIDEDKPTACIFESGLNSSKQEKKSYLHKVASLVVDTFVIDKERNEHMEQSMRSIQQEFNERPNANGRYPCRCPGCPKTFAHPGKLRRDHESQHNPRVMVSAEAPIHVLDSKTSADHKGDDMFSYQRALLDYGMLVLNFWDAISEGDGDRVFRCWKFFLMYLKHQGGSASKYSLEALYLVFQVHALLSPRSAQRLIWNRFVKNKPGLGGNIPLDLQLEFYNKSVKEATKKLGPSASRKSIDRICCSLGITTTLMNNFDSSLSVFKRSGKHVKMSTKGDLGKIVQELNKHKAFTYTPGRRNNFYSGMKSSLLTGFNMRNEAIENERACCVQIYSTRGLIRTREKC